MQDLSHLKEQCAAFKEGCPFAKVEDKQLVEAIEKCPEFKDGCPFKDAKSLAEVYEKLSHIPHAAGHESEFSGQKLIEMFKKIHDTSECLEEKLGDCPVFHKDQGCPFKSVRSEEGKHLVEPVESVGHDKHVIDDLKTVDAMHLEDQCPAFKEGCPFAKVEDKDLVKAIEKCPEFKDGCPFKDAKSLAEVYEKLSHIPHAAGHESELSGRKLIEMFKKMHDTSECLEEKLGDCPVFHKDQGCPFKSVRSEEGKHLVEPVESVGHDKHAIDELKTVDAAHLEDQCPAFKEGCPFAKVEDKDLIEAIEKCPEFKNGCPFKDAKSLAEVYEKLSHVPHSAGHESELSGQKLIEMFKKMHDTSECLEEKLGDCPVFHKDQGCPFKSVRSDHGKHLVEPVESVVSQVRKCGPPSPSKKKVMTTEVTSVTETCPAFQASCPFSSIASQDGETFKNVMNCPAFKDGCAFKKCKSISDVYLKLQEIPNLSEEKGSHGEILESLKVIHQICVDMKNELGDCPVFKTELGCPFKTVCSDGSILIEKLEFYVTSRAFDEAIESAKEAAEKELISSSGIVLSGELKAGTLKIHQVARNVFFVRQLLKGKVTPAVYKLLLSNLYFIYRTLEEETEKNKSHPQLQSTSFPKELYRTSEIIKDLEYFYGEDWEAEIKPITSIKNYMARLRKLGEEDPLMLVAHQYTRYMGDLAGGQIVKRVLMKTMGLSVDGLKFYDFEHVPSNAAFKGTFRSRLDSLGLDRKTADRMLEESIKSYELNIAMFNELSVLCGFESEDVGEMQTSPPEVVESKTSTGKCPFMSVGPTNTSHGKTAASEESSIPEAEAGTHVSVGNSGKLFVILGITVALFAILYAYLLA